jgi:NAD(P)-dependent dehydrogenase (short-subunit alcohol dehydrogenase family)
MRDTAAAQQMIGQVHQHYGRIDILINNPAEGMHVPVT